MLKWIKKLPVPQPVRHWVISPLWCAIVRLSKPEVRIVTGGISFYLIIDPHPSLSPPAGEFSLQC